MPSLTASIRIRRFRPASPGWDMDCILIPSDEHFGGLVHHNPNGIQDFRGKIEPGLFASLYGLPGSLIPETVIFPERKSGWLLAD
jgi:hypothetical protein